MKEEVKKQSPESESKDHVMAESSFDSKPVSNAMTPPAFGLMATGAQGGAQKAGAPIVVPGQEVPSVEQEAESEMTAQPLSESKATAPAEEEPESGTTGTAIGTAVGTGVGAGIGGAIGGGIGAAVGSIVGGVVGGMIGNHVENSLIPTVNGVMTPRDNFAGRSTTDFGVAEVIDLSFASTATAASLGGLKWSVAGGGGVLSSVTSAGTATLTCPDAADTVNLELKIETGSNAGFVVARQAVKVVAPNDALMVKDGRAIRHANNTWSAGFYGEIFLRPMNVSFSRIEFQEGAAPAVASGFLAHWNGLNHNPSSAAMSVGGGNSATGSKVNAIDNVHTGTLGSPYAVGDFNWPIPWQYRVGTGAWTTFTTANHHATSDALGTATIEKKGEGPHSKVPGDPTVNN